MELKTLKDIDGEKCILNEDCRLIHEKLLKSEAIKWLEKYYHPDKTTIPIVAWLDFFNIIESDLNKTPKETK